MSGRLPSPSDVGARDAVAGWLAPSTPPRRPRLRLVAAGLRRGVEAWYDLRGDRGLWVLLALFVAVWTAFQIVSYAFTDLHPDLVEVYAWGRHPSFGYSKHPPLGGALTALWFSVFPARDWAFHLLAMLNAAVALYAVDRIAQLFLAGDKRLLVMLLLLLTPFYQFHAQRFASNQTLLSAWPIATWCFIRAFQTRRPGWAMAAGIAGAVAMLGKYSSVYLLAGFAIAAIVHPRRADYFRSSSPWISIAAGLLVLAPHIEWLRANGFQPFVYAMAVHGHASFGAAAGKALVYLVEAIAYVSVPLAVWWVTLRPDWATIREALLPSDADRRMLAVLLWVPLILPALVAPFIGALLTPLWTMQAWFLLPILLLAPATAVVRRPAAVATAVLVAAITAACLLASPAIAWMRHVNGSREDRAYFRLLAEATTARWQALTGKTLSIVMGDLDLASASAFYSPDHPDAVPGFQLNLTPWVTEVRLAREGYAVLCKAADSGCLDAARRRLAERDGSTTADLVLTRRALGWDGPSRRFSVFLIPPRP